jgi:hypothetical protein
VGHQVPLLEPAVKRRLARRSMVENQFLRGRVIGIDAKTGEKRH